MRLRGSVGPILTTGVALAAAAVVVANPVMAPRADIRIPAIELSAGHGDPLAMLDDDFLRAIAPAPPQATGPVAVLKDLFSSLAADASYLGKNAVVSALIAGASVVADPELTALSHPYVPVPTGPVDPVWPDMIAVAPDYLPPAVVPFPDGEFATTVATAVTTIINDVTYGIEAQVISMAFAAGAFLATETGHVIDTLGSLVTGDLDGALRGAAAGITEVATASVAIVDAIRTFVEQGFPVPSIVVKPIPASATTVESPDDSSTSSLPITAPDAAQDGLRPEAAGRQRSAVLPRPAGSASGGSAADAAVADPADNNGGVPTSDTPDADTPGADTLDADTPAAETPGDIDSGVITPGDIETRDGNKAAPAPRPSRPAGVRDQVSGPLRAAVDAVRDAADRATKATARTGD